ncbi:branched-chain amino acid ABC transporter substrate-binding protein [Trinickia caryophylli]|uniref:Amino acid/amide ABC transporter substrate-binding protein, HAAT family n=1 Tax=Trinickia caryophylli TaxID=28094 RepID=A0A1X7FHL6_TRICW|nr:branched-chain amino acid ABC transporter substrate-binding protein [Trinickia caryophylli]PMS13237.1 branched-chain amino acid ABC transporter substrate-binding protein [Trinickia caryophylli]TRX19238.1 branched-chain amino acid ABC transporter substrate-binding protein [Trinickia caryophylli]WQE13463.1 branched-chain amino acid ABC transporter substrate-binding protein [Trinickia caryophylli]SMF52420.1 amino acid/amide ABC transporter substrate-binding protein, HAAT family [Trinickia caryo
MKSKMQKVLPISAAAMLFATLATGAAADQTVKIGHVAPLTGQIAHLGKDNENGARLAVEEINAKGLTIGGQKITLQLDAQDDAADPRQATQVAQKLVDDKVVAVVGHLNSGTSIPASKIYSDAGIVQISPSATNPQYTLQGFKTTYRVVATDAQQGPALANYAASLKIKKVAVVDDATAYGQGLANEFEKKAKALGLQVLSHDATNDKATDFRAILTKIKGENPDVIMYGGMDATGGPFAKQAKQLGLRAKVLAGDGVCTDQLATLAGDAAANVVCSEAGRSLEKMGKEGEEFQAKFKKRFGVPIQIYAPFTYDAVYIIVDAMKRAGSVDSAKILAAMPATNYKGVIGTTQFDEHGDLKHGVISLYYYKDGKKTLMNEVSM